MRAGGEAALLGLVWQTGQDPYCVYNGLDESYRPLSHRHPCPSCLSVRIGTDPCRLCGWRGFVEIPREEPGEPAPPPHPRRIRNFIYGVATAMEERGVKTKQASLGG